jgi:hypothetical protein
MLPVDKKQTQLAHNLAPPTEEPNNSSEPNRICRHRYIQQYSKNKSFNHAKYLPVLVAHQRLEDPGCLAATLESINYSAKRTTKRPKPWHGGSHMHAEKAYALASLAYFYNSYRRFDSIKSNGNNLNNFREKSRLRRLH